MLNRKAYLNFINGRYFSEGLRVTAGILFPALVLSYFNLLAVGIVISIGALCVSAADTPGPMTYRVNGMLLCSIVISFVSVITSYSAGSPIIICLLIFIFGFVFSMLTVYGTRTSAIGIAALLVMILNMENTIHGLQVWTNALYILTGATWYMLFSLALYKIYPYKLIRQITGDYLQSVSVYLRTRGAFYDVNPKYEQLYQLQLAQQREVLTHQNLLNDLLFKTRAAVKESTQTGRVLLKIYLDVSDLFESIMSTHSPYKVLHETFDNTGILKEFELHIFSLADQLEQIALTLKSGTSSKIKTIKAPGLEETRKHFESLRLNFMTSENIENFISLGRILQNLEELEEKINMMQAYTREKKKIKSDELSGIEERYIETTDIRLSLFIDNLNTGSNIFRHSIRMALALITGYICSLFFHIGHSYWILLTIVVILKPAYSLTKKRNADRLLGTFLGVLAGIFILLVIKNNTALLIIMIFLMAGSYIFLRTSYFTSVLFMTPYLVIFFHLLNPANLKMVLSDRIIDTAIGSGIAFLANIFLIPQWGYVTIRKFMVEALESNMRYYLILANAYTTHSILDNQLQKKTRKEALVAHANLSDAFTQILSEPKRFQKNTETIHQFVVLNHLLASHLATLSYYLKFKKNYFHSLLLLPVIENTELYFNAAKNLILGKEDLAIKVEKNPFGTINKYVEDLLSKRKEEISAGEYETETKNELVKVKSVVDQFNYIFTVSGDIYKCAKSL